MRDWRQPRMDLRNTKTRHFRSFLTCESSRTESNTNCLWRLIDKAVLLPRLLSHFTADLTRNLLSVEWMKFVSKISGQNHWVQSLRQQWDFLDFSTWSIVSRRQFMGSCLCFGITSFLEHCCDSCKIIQVWNSRPTHFATLQFCLKKQNISALSSSSTKDI